MLDQSIFPTLVRICFNLISTLTSSKYRDYFARYKSMYPYMMYTIVSAICNIFGQLNKAAKHPNNIHRLKIDNSVAKKVVSRPLV